MSRIYDLLKASDERVGALQPQCIKHNRQALVGRGARKTPRVQRSRDEEGQGWIRLLAILQKHWQLSTLFALSIFAGVAIVTFLAKPTYEPAVTLEIDPPGTQALSLERSTGGGSDDTQYLETQAKELQSDELALAVIRKLGLAHNPEFAHTSRSRRELTQIAQTDEAVVQLASTEAAALDTFRNRLRVERDTGSKLVTLRFASHDPGIAAQVANTLVSEFIHNNFVVRYHAIMESSAWLSRQLDDIRAKMQQSNDALVAFQNRTGIADLDTNKSTLADQIAEFDRQLALAQSDRLQLEAVLAKAEKASLESLPQVGDNPVVEQLTQNLAEARVELSKAQVDYGNNHPALKKLKSRIDQLQSELDLQKDGIFERLKTGYAAAQARERLLNQQRQRIGKQINQLAQYNALKKEFQAETDLYNSLYTRVKEAGIAAASNSYNIRVIDHARVLDSPTYPRTMLNLGFGFLAAAFGGVLIACLREALNNTIHTPEDIRNVTGVATISMLPVIEDAADAAGTMLGSVFARYSSSGRHRHYCNPKFLLDRPNSAAAEALRGLYTTVIHSREGTLPRVLLVVSALASEGKTTVASNLAVALAQRGPTCLADADLRRAGISHLFGLQSRKGLADLITGSVALEEVTIQVPDIPRLHIVPSGSPNRNPAELMADARIYPIVSLLRERFHFVVFDAPPVLPYADGRVLSTLVDGLIAVVRYRITTREAISRTIEVLSEIEAAPILQIVLNGGNSMVPGSQYYCTGSVR
jgi:polysaccharide biosynthesis transport protein